MATSTQPVQGIRCASYNPFAEVSPGRIALRLLLVGAMLAALPGCGPKRMKADFIGFEKAYAETSNREVLLNLARLQNHDTTYFFKLGQISSTYRMQASLTGAGNYVTQGTGVGGNAVGGGTPGLIFENDPSFTFIPVNDETSAQLLLKPVPANTFYNLYLQGWRVDQLFRLMVDRIELTVPDGRRCKVQTYRNLPPAARLPSTTASDPTFLSEADNFATFLRISALVYGLQRHGHLLLKGTTTFIPFDSRSKVPNDSTAPKPADIAAAAAKNQSWQLGEDGKWVLGQQVQGAQFYLNPTPSEVGSEDVFQEILQDIASDGDLGGLEMVKGSSRAMTILGGGFSIEEARADGSAVDACTALRGKGLSAHLVLRSLLGLMAAAAQEQDAFTGLLQNPANLPTTGLPFSRSVPPIERLPALRLRWTSQERSGVPLVQIAYRGATFEVADGAAPPSPQDVYWNRDMFRLINQLTSQVTVDISKFPLPGILNLHTN